MRKKKKNYRKIIIIGLIIIVMILLIGKITNKQKNITENEIKECTELEKIALEYYIQTINLSMIIKNEGFEDIENAKIRYAINEYLKYDTEEIMTEDIYYEYKKIFDVNEKDKDKLVAKINEVLNVDGILQFNPVIEKYERQDVNLNELGYSDYKSFNVLKQVKKIEENEYELEIEVVGSINIEELKNYYQNEYGINRNMDLTDLYNAKEGEEYKLVKYLTKDNYERVSNEVKSTVIRVKTIGEEIKVVEI